MKTIWQDIRFGVRMLVKKPGFSVVAVLTLAVGISANITMFSVVNAVLLRPLPFDDPDRLVVVQQHGTKRGWTAGLSYPYFQDWRKQDQVFDDFAAYTPAQYDLTDSHGVSKIDGATVTTNFFSMLGVSAFQGRVFAESDEQQDYGLASVISYDFWQNKFGKSRDVLGQTMILNDKAYTIIGVLRPDFIFPDVVQDAQIWTILKPSGDRLTNRSLCWLCTVGRLKPGMSIERAVELQNRWFAANGDTDTEVLMTGLHDTVVRLVRTTLWILSVIVGFILLIVCANVANLCLAKASTRDKEIAVRLALGADRLRLLRQFITESLIMSVVGGIAGLILTMWIIAVFRVRIGNFVPMADLIRIKSNELLFGLGLSILVGLFLGIIPFCWTQRSKLVHLLTERRNISGHWAGFSNLLVTGQIAVALVLSIGMVLMIRSMMRLSSENIGFNRENLVTFNIGVRGMSEPQRYQLSKDLLERLRALPYVKAASTDSSMLCSPRASSAPVNVEGHQSPDDKRYRACIHNVSEDYFRTLQISFLKGRNISPAEQQKKEPVVVINEALARQFWKDEDPTGKLIDFCGAQYQVIGVVANMIQGNVKADKPNHLFFPFDKVWPGPELKVVVRSTSGSGLVVQQARGILKQIDVTLPLYGVSTFKAQMNACIDQERFTTTFLTVFSAIALLLIIIGVYGVVSYAVVQRTREIGVRMALGAQKKSVMAMILRRGLLLSIGGSAVGIAGAVCLTRFLSSYLFGVSATDPLTFILAPLLIIIVATLACYVPARRAAKIDPMEALRYE